MATVASIPTLADLLSVETEVELDGKAYKLRPPTLLEQGRYQRWLEQGARESVARATYISEADRAAAQNAVTQDVSAGVYAFGGPVCINSLQHAEGVAKLVEIILRIPGDQARRLVDNHLLMIAALIRAAIDDDPKAVAAALKALGLPPTFLTPPRPKPGSSSSSGTRRTAKRKKKSRR